MQVLSRRWIWIVGFIIALMLLAVGITLTLQPTYEATALLSVATTPGDILLSSPAQHLAVLQSTAVASRTLELLGRMGENERPDTLSRKVRVINDPQDKALIRIIADAGSPQRAMAIANLWAEAGIELTTRRLTGEVLDITQKKSQLALERLRKADEGISNYVQQNGLSWLEVATLEDFSGSVPALFPDQGLNRLSSLSAAQLEELNRLLRERAISSSVYAEFAKQEEEHKIMADIMPSNLVLRQTATLPTAPIQPKMAQNLAIGGVLGLIFGLMAAFGVDYLVKAQASESTV